MDRRRRCPDPPQTPPPNRRFSPFLHDISNFQTPNPSPSPIFFTASRNTPSSTSRRPFTPSLHRSKAARRLKALELEQSKSARKYQTGKAKTLKSFSRSVTAWLDFLLENPKDCGCDIGVGFDGGRGWKRLKICEEEEEVGVEMTAPKVSELRNSLKDVCSLDDLKERMDRYMSKKGCNEVLWIMSRLCKNIDEGRLKMKAHCPIVTDLALKEKTTKVLMCYNTTWLRVGLHIVLGGDSLLTEEGKSDQEGLFLKLIIENQFFTHMLKARSYAYNKLVVGLYKPGFYEALGSIILKRFLLLVVSLDKAKCESILPLRYGIDGIDGGSPLLFSCHSHIKSSRQAVQEFLSEAMHGEGDLLSHLAILGCKLNYQQFPLVEYDFRVRNLFEDLHDGIILCRAIHLLKNDASILPKVVAPPDSHKKRLQNCSTAMQHLKQDGVRLTDEDGIQIAAEDIVNGDKELTLSILWNTFVQLQVPLLIDKTLLTKEISKLKGCDVVLPNSQGNSALDLLLSWVQAVCEIQGIKIDNFSSIIEGKAFCCLIDYYMRTEICRYSTKENQVHCVEELFRDMVTVATDRARNISFIPSVVTMLGNVPKVFQLSDMLDQDFAYDERSVVILLVFLSSRLINRKIGDELRCRGNQQNFRNTDLEPLIVPQSPLFKDSVPSNRVQWKKLLEFVSRRNKSSRLDEETAACIIQSHFRRFTACRKSLKIMTKVSLQEWPASVFQTHSREFCVAKKFFDIQNASFLQGRASIVIQSHFRGFTERKKFTRIKIASCTVQSAVRAWLVVNSRSKLKTFSLVLSRHEPPYGICNRYLMFMFERHRFLRIRNSVLLIQRAARAWFTQKNQRKDCAILAFVTHDSITAFISIQSVIRGQNVRSRYVNKLATLEDQQGVTPELEDCEHLCMPVGRASIVIQSHFRGFTERKKFTRIKMASCTVQSAVRAWLVVNSRSKLKTFSLALSGHEPLYGICSGYLRFMFERHRFLRIRNSVLLIQRAARAWFTQKNRRKDGAILAFITHDSTTAFISIQSVIRGQNVRSRYDDRLATPEDQQGVTHELEDCEHLCRAAIRIQSSWKKFMKHRLHMQTTVATTRIQKYWRGWYLRKNFLSQVAAATEIQANIRCFMQKKAVSQYRSAAIKIQRSVRRRLAWKWLIGTSVPFDGVHFGSYNMAYTYQNPEVKIMMDSILKVQRWWKQVLLMKSRTVSAILIQSFIRGLNTRRTTGKRMSSISIIQRWWSNVLLIKLRKKSATLIQTHVRGWIARRRAEHERLNIVIIQSHWKGYIVRKHSREQVSDLRLRLQKSSVNVDDNRRLINKLVAALSELLGCRSVSNIRHTCVTLNSATELSQKCCETLVSAGAIHILLKQFHSLNRGIPDQEVLKLVISTLKNISCYPQLVQVLIDTPHAVEIIFQELLRNKSEVFFITYELLKKICATQDGLTAIRKLRVLVRRLNNLVCSLERKFELQKRKAYLCTGKDVTMRRLRAAADLMQLISCKP